jgi:hypothetical protein
LLTRATRSHLGSDGVRTDDDYRPADSIAPWSFTMPSDKYANGSNRVDGLSRVADLGTTDVGHLQLDGESRGRTFGVAFDDVLVDEPPPTP